MICVKMRMRGRYGLKPLYPEDAFYQLFVHEAQSGTVVVEWYCVRLFIEDPRFESTPE